MMTINDDEIEKQLTYNFCNVYAVNIVDFFTQYFLPHLSFILSNSLTLLLTFVL